MQTSKTYNKQTAYKSLYREFIAHLTNLNKTLCSTKSGQEKIIFTSSLNFSGLVRIGI